MRRALIFCEWEWGARARSAAYKNKNKTKTFPIPISVFRIPLGVGHRAPSTAPWPGIGPWTGDSQTPDMCQCQCQCQYRYQTPDTSDQGDIKRFLCFFWTVCFSVFGGGGLTQAKNQGSPSNAKASPCWGEGRSSPTTPIYAPKSLGKPPCRGSHHPSSVFQAQSTPGTVPARPSSSAPFSPPAEGPGGGLYWLLARAPCRARRAHTRLPPPLASLRPSRCLCNPLVPRSPGWVLEGPQQPAAGLFSPVPPNGTNPSSCPPPRPALPLPAPPSPLGHHPSRCFSLRRLPPPADVVACVFVVAPLCPKHKTRVAREVHHPLLHCYLHRATPVRTHAALPAAIACVGCIHFKAPSPCTVPAAHRSAH
jgi:hypothetical protein